MSSSATSNSSNICVITNVDSLTGYALAYHILEKIRNRQDTAANRRVRVLTRSRDSQLNLDVLKEMNAEVMEIDYNDENRVREAVRDARNVILIPEQSRNRVREAENVIKAAKHTDVDHFVLVSITGVDCLEQRAQFGHYPNLSEYYRIEERVKESFQGKKHCIIRHSVFNQLFYFMGPQIENDNKLSLPIEKSDKWCAVDLNDFCEGMWRLARKHQEGSDISSKKTFNFCADHARSTEDHVRDMGKGLNRDELRFNSISENEMRQYLKQMREDEHFRERPKHSRDESNSRRERDTFSTLPLGRFLNDQCIETMEEFWKSASEGYQNLKCDDLKDVLEREPQNLKHFFKNNRENFKRLK
ncbi:hypothetical protein K501DRAFT_195909 [Backusella circina FSU 941]|nr:hypothetical protein K501DRAFT_195909 [Backusella circina FSU 941]